MTMSKIDVTIYEKTQSPCPYCDNMRRHFLSWQAKSTDTVTAEFKSAEENIDTLITLGASAAPVYIIKRGKNESIVYGNNPDVLIDSLEGVDGVWDF